MHYVPIQLDLSDLHDALFFFRGDGNGDGAHEHLSRKIAVAGRKWSKTFWRQEDLIAYFFRFVLFSLQYLTSNCYVLITNRRLTLEYARLMSMDREAMSYSD